MAAPDYFALFGPSPGNLLGPGTVPTEITASASDLATRPRFLHVSGAAGSVTYVAGGVTVTETLELGYHPIRPDKITAIAGGTKVVAWV